MGRHTGRPPARLHRLILLTTSAAMIVAALTAVTDVSARAAAPRTGIISGRVVAEDGTRLAGVTVVLHTTDLGEADVVQRASTSTSGRFVFRGVKPYQNDVFGGDYQIEALGPDHRYLDGWYERAGATQPSTITLQPGQHVAGRIITLRRGAYVAGTVTDVHGKPVSGVRVELQPGATTGGDFGDRTTTDKHGRYRLVSVPGTGYLHLGANDYINGIRQNRVAYRDYPDAPAAVDARTITLTTYGQVVHANVVLKRRAWVPKVRVTGHTVTITLKVHDPGAVRGTAAVYLTLSRHHLLVRKSVANGQVTLKFKDSRPGKHTYLVRYHATYPPPQPFPVTWELTVRA